MLDKITDGLNNEGISDKAGVILDVFKDENDKNKTEKVISIKKAVDTLKEVMHQDPNYAWSWQCNLAMCAYDEGVSHAAANRAAARFISLLFDIDMTTSEHFKRTQVVEE